MCKTIEVYLKTDFRKFKMAFEFARKFYSFIKKDSNFIGAVEEGRRLLKLNKGFAKAMERRVGFNPTKDEDIAAFAFGIYEAEFQRQQKAKALQNT